MSLPPIDLTEIIVALIGLAGIGLGAGWYAGRKARADTIASQQDTIGDMLTQIDGLVKGRREDREALEKALGDIGRLKSDVAALNIQVHDKDKTIVRLQNENHRLTAEVGQLKARVAELEKQQPATNGHP
jgi:chromosome segregation ATPase